MVTATQKGVQEGKDLDKIFLYAAHQVKGIQPLLRSFFGFLQRQTDFYEASTEAAQHMVLMSFQEFCEVHKNRSAEKCVPIPQVETASIEEVGSENNADSPNSSAQNVQNEEDTDKPSSKVAAEDSCSTEEDHNGFYEESRRTKKGSVYPNEGDGATYKHYKWTQSPTELEILVPLCKHRLKLKKTLQVNYTSSSIFAYIQDKKMFGGILADKIKSDEVTWTLEDNIICVRAEKVKKAWWKQLLITEPMLLLKPILRKHASLSDIGEEEMKQYQQTVVNKRDYTIAKHTEQFPDKLPIPEHLQ
ncbi:nuclear migration protein nudC-like [Bolinopsis microptera]|uniref:nuclear migration protein nudC-like n=1 Tax=Bolinopsis microptera TaxID=2820187 RepID=UPI0030793404